jgi:serine phosphatase RsbU (regulator of sigma subunit)
LWAGTKYVKADGGILFRVYRYSVKEDKLREFVFADYGSSGHIGISQDNLGYIWVAMDDGLRSVHPTTFKDTFYPAGNGFLSNISYFHGNDNVIYQGYWSFGVTAFDIDTKEYKVIKNDPDNPRSLISNKVWSLYKDENDVMWYGTDVGLQKQSNKRPNLEIITRKAEFTNKTFRSNQMLSVAPCVSVKNKILVGVDGEGLAIYDRVTQQTENYTFGNRSGDHTMEERFIARFYEKDNGVIYMAGQYNFQKLTLTPTSSSVKPYFSQQQHHLLDLFPDHSNKNLLWLASIGQVIKFDPGTEKFEFIEKPLGLTGIFYAGVSNASGTYFSTNNAILKIRPDKTMQKINLPEAGNITCMENYDESHLLIASSFQGLVEFDVKKNTYRVIKNNRNDYFTEIKCIKKIRNSFWIGTSVGLFQYFPFSGEILEYTTVDGLPSNVIQKIDYYEGYLYLATANGLVIFNPNVHNSHFTVPKLDITSLVGIGNKLNIISDLNGKTIEIPQAQNSFRISFTVLDFNLPEKNSYRYKLLPVQSDWKNNNNDHTVSFNELNVGEYEFQVIGANSDNTWNTDPVSVKIKIIPPFYNSNAFYYLCGVIALILIAVIAYARYRSVKSTREFLERTIEERTEEIKEKQKALEKSNTELTDGIIYAQKIQKAFLVGEKILSKALANSFIYFRPKEHVSGDFFWIGEENNFLIIAAGDCTGHGVPGAMLSVIGTSLLNKIVHQEKILTPGKILTELNYEFFHQLNVDERSVRDGMDISVVAIDMKNKKMFFAGARNSGAMVIEGMLSEFKAQRETIGENERVDFNTKSVIYDNTATYYLYSDGFKDQFGGPQMKKLASKQFKEILTKGSRLEMNGQRNYFSRFIKDWQGTNSQTDDRMIIGFKVP